MRFGPSDLTIALCTIGRPGYLRAAVESLLATTPDGVALRVVLNACPAGTRDDLEELVQRWHGPVEVIEVAERLPIHESHNLALAGCRTALISFMGDDDLVIEPRLDRMLQLFDLEPMPLVVSSFAKRTGGTPFEPVFAGNKDLGPTSIAEWERWRDDGELFELCFPSAILVTDAAREIGGFEEKFGPTMDVAIFTRLSRRGPVIADTRRTFGYRVHDGSLSTADGAQLAELLRYVGACAEAMDADTPEPTIAEFRAREAAQPLLTRVRRELRVTSQVRFRRAGAAMLRRDRIEGARHLAVAAAASPAVLTRKLVDQIGRPWAPELMTPIRRDDPEWISEVDAAVAALATDAPVVTILVRGLHNYRVMFYEHLRSILADAGVRLRVVHGQGSAQDRAKGDLTRLSWSETLPVHTLKLGSRELLWQNGVRVARTSDLVVCEQASRLLLNYVLVATHPIWRHRIALWGHGKSLRSDVVAMGELVKRWLTKRAHWFFAYNQTSVDYVADLGFPTARITSLLNATDTKELREATATYDEAAIAAARAELGIRGDHVGVFIGGIYDLKRPQFLIAAAEEIRSLVDDFELLVIGKGPDELVVKDAAARYDWCHYIGPVFGVDRVRYGAVSDLFLLPGAIGLNIVDAFAMGLAVASVDLPYHGPEVEYLVDGVNGVMLERAATPAQYAAVVARILRDDDERARLRAGAEDAAKELTIEGMAQRFADGALQALRVAP